MEITTRSGKGKGKGSRAEQMEERHESTRKAHAHRAGGKQMNCDCLRDVPEA